MACSCLYSIYLSIHPSVQSEPDSTDFASTTVDYFEDSPQNLWYYFPTIFYFRLRKKEVTK